MENNLRKNIYNIYIIYIYTHSLLYFYIKDPTIRTETTNLLEKNINVDLCDLKFDTDVLDMHKRHKHKIKNR